MPGSEIRLHPCTYEMPVTLIVTGPLVFRGAGLDEVPVRDRLTLGAQNSGALDRVHDPAHG